MLRGSSSVTDERVGHVVVCFGVNVSATCTVYLRDESAKQLQCYHSETEVANGTCDLSQWQHADSRPAKEPITQLSYDRVPVITGLAQRGYVLHTQFNCLCLTPTGTAGSDPSSAALRANATGHWAIETKALDPPRRLWTSIPDPLAYPGLAAMRRFSQLKHAAQTHGCFDHEQFSPTRVR